MCSPVGLMRAHEWTNRRRNKEGEARAQAGLGAAQCAAQGRPESTGGAHLAKPIVAISITMQFTCYIYLQHREHSMSEATFSFQVDASLKEQFTTAAKARDASEAELMREFMREFVKRQQREAAEYDAHFRQAVQAGINAANAGDVLSAEEVEAEAAIWRADMRRKISAS